MRGYIGVTNGTAMTSGFKTTRDEVEKWASDVLFNHPKVTSVAVCEAVARVERDAPPIKTVELKDEPDALVIPKDSFNSKFGPSQNGVANHD